MDLHDVRGRLETLTPGTRDALLALALVVVTQQDLWVAPDYGNRVGPRPVVACFYLATSVAIAWRRRSAVAVLAFVFTVGTVQYLAFGAPESLGSFLPQLIALYSVGRFSEPRSILLAGPVALLGTAVHELKDPVFQITGVSYFFWALLAMAWPLGRAFRRREIDVANLTEEARALERDREERTRAAIAAERTRIARELHDVVGHGVSLVVLQLEAAVGLLDKGETAASRRSLLNTERSARQTLAEMRRLVGLLDQDEDASLVPQPGLRELGPLVSEIRAAGCRVEMVTEGRHVDLPPGLDLAAFRVVQEALTNVLRHSRPPVACLHIRYRPAHLTLEVTNQGVADPTDQAGSRNGRGIAGMRERVALYGGELAVGPRADGGFMVRARFPLEVTQP